MGRNTNGFGLGRYTTLHPVTTSTTNKVQKPTRTIKISEHLYRRFVGFSKRYYDVESYETILENLIKFYEDQNPDTRYYHTNKS